ncbi:MAG: hypothetical protein JO316_13110 [Abitibacteriaceae bacterium]|nr:hypothetical protein [Abditibacteriaceae bacterium]MBV9866284.1 hypothetical protein [Abditibacteriaceae bacterium]
MNSLTHHTQERIPGHWYLIRSVGGRWMPFKLLSEVFVEFYGDEFEWHGPFSTMAEAYAAIPYSEEFNESEHQ